MTRGVASWIGLVDTQLNPLSPTDYRWTDNSPSNYKNWHDNNCQGETCEAEKQWYKKNGADRAPSVCKKRSNKVSTVGIQNLSAELLLEQGIGSIIKEQQVKSSPTKADESTSSMIVTYLKELIAVTMKLYLYMSL